MNFKTKSELLVLVFRINVISNFGCRSPCMAFLPPSGGVFRLSHLGVIAGYPMQTVMRFSRFNRQNDNKKAVTKQTSLAFAFSGRSC
mgnify:CR=1 FL=1